MTYHEMTPETVWEQPDMDQSGSIKRRRKIGRKTASLTAAAILVSGGLASAHYNSQSGDMYNLSRNNGSFAVGPGRMSVGEPNPSAYDDQLRVMSWNMHNEAGDRVDEIQALFNNGQLDALLIQEINASDAATLATHLPGQYVNFVVGEALPRPGYLEPFGNAIITDSLPLHTDSASLSGTSNLQTAVNFVTGLPADIWHRFVDRSDQRRNWQNLTTSWHENRAVQQVAIATSIGGQAVNVSLTNTHLSYIRDSPIQDQQLDQLADFVDQSDIEAEVNVICGDFNTTDKARIINLFAEKYHVDDTPPTTSYDDLPIDFCLTNIDDSLVGLLTPHTTVDENHRTDHTALVTTVYADR